jgi:hypothetical protein
MRNELSCWRNRHIVVRAGTNLYISFKYFWDIAAEVNNLKVIIVFQSDPIVCCQIEAFNIHVLILV